jgi:hypothetical protein
MIMLEGIITNFGIGVGVEIVEEMLGMFDCLCGFLLTVNCRVLIGQVGLWGR